ncbi:pentapeptide repeat-containing protein [Streptomyces sp. NPDC047043]|uniref:pentapeptide repeat-containing protein n=1 Tax=Streptomyces sp. NPDC047043 TaxID=3154497 RepID=UPI0033F57291
MIRVIREHLQPGTDTAWSGCNFDFTGATFDGGDLARCDFRGTVLFTGATFSGDIFTFRDATFSAGAVTFRDATFSGGTVDMRSVGSWATPPCFDAGVLDNPPTGLLLPPPIIG